MARRRAWSKKLRASETWQVVVVHSSDHCTRLGSRAVETVFKQIDEWMQTNGRDEYMMHIQDRDRLGLVAFKDETDRAHVSLWFQGDGIYMTGSTRPGEGFA